MVTASIITMNTITSIRTITKSSCNSPLSSVISSCCLQAESSHSFSFCSCCGFKRLLKEFDDTMARQEQDREDLLRDATAMVERVEFVLPNQTASIFVGFRRDGCASIYIDQDPTYHFNTQNELRRAYVAGRLYKAEHRRLVSLLRERPGDEVHLVRHELSEEETAAFLDAMQQCLQQLAQGLSENGFTLIGQVPDDADIVNRVQLWLANLPQRVSIAASPRAI
jgi:hypothetical protein